MTEKVREKLKTLLVKKGLQEKGKTEQFAFLIGDLIHSMRIRRNFIIEDVVQGICGIATLERLKHGDGEEFPDSSLLTLLFNRMGVSAEKFEFYFDKNGEERMMIRECLVKWRQAAVAGVSFLENEMIHVLYQRLRLEKGASYEQALKAYTRKYSVTWEKRWAYWQYLIYKLASDSLIEEVRKAWEELSAWKLYYTEEEWEFLYALASYFAKVGDYENANKVYAKMYQNATGSKNTVNYCQGMDEERQLELLPKFCLVYGGFLSEYEKMREADQKRQGVDVFTVPEWDAGEIFLYGIQLNCKFSRDYMLYELMEAYCLLLYGRMCNQRDAVQSLDLLRYEQYLVALEIAQGSYMKAKKRLDFMKEELQWENTTLVHTYNVLERRQG